MTRSTTGSPGVTSMTMGNPAVEYRSAFVSRFVIACSARGRSPATIVPARNRDPQLPVAAARTEPLDGGLDRGAQVERRPIRLDPPAVCARIELEPLEDADGGLDRVEGAVAVVARALRQLRIAHAELDAGLRHRERVPQLVGHVAGESRESAALVLLPADVAQQQHAAATGDRRALDIEQEVAARGRQPDEVATPHRLPPCEELWQRIARDAARRARPAGRRADATAPAGTR